MMYCGFYTLVGLFLSLSIAHTVSAESWYDGVAQDVIKLSRSVGYDDRVNTRQYFCRADKAQREIGGPRKVVAVSLYEQRKCLAIYGCPATSQRVYARAAEDIDSEKDLVNCQNGASVVSAYNQFLTQNGKTKVSLSQQLKLRLPGFLRLKLQKSLGKPAKGFRVMGVSKGQKVLNKVSMAFKRAQCSQRKQGEITLTLIKSAATKLKPKEISVDYTIRLKKNGKAFLPPETRTREEVEALVPSFNEGLGSDETVDASAMIFRMLDGQNTGEDVFAQQDQERENKIKKMMAEDKKAVMNYYREWTRIFQRCSEMAKRVGRNGLNRVNFYFPSAGQGQLDHMVVRLEGEANETQGFFFESEQEKFSELSLED